MKFNKKLNRQQQRRVHKITGQELQGIIDKSSYEAIGVALEVFQKVMKEEFGFGDKRLGRLAQAIHEELGIEEEAKSDEGN